MPTHTVSSREFARNLSSAKQAAMAGPVIITDRGRPAFALLNIDDYQRLLAGDQMSLLEVMDGIPGGAVEFEPPRVTIQSRTAGFE